MKKNSGKVWLGVALASAWSASQLQADPLVSDRPDFTESAETIAKGRTQVEAGLTLGKAGSAREQSFGEVLLRIGTSDKTELRIGIPSYLRVKDGGQKSSGLDDAFIGGKVVLKRGEGKKPQVAVLGALSLPTGSRDVAERKVSPELILALASDLSERFSFSSNLGYGRPSVGGHRFAQYFGSLSLGVGVSEKVGSYVEVYRFNRSEAGGGSSSVLNGGFTYAVSDDLQLDAFIGRGLNGGSDRETFVGTGVVRRF